MGRRAFGQWLEATSAVPAALALMAQRRRSTIEALMNLEEHNLLSTIRELLAAEA